MVAAQPQTQVPPQPKPGMLRGFVRPTLGKRFLRVGIWGAPNSGKTTFACSIVDTDEAKSKKVVVLYTDDSAVPVFDYFKSAVEAGRFVAKRCTKLEDVEEAIEDLKRIPPDKFQQEIHAVVLDTVTDYYDWLVNKKSEQLQEAGKKRGFDYRLIPSDYRDPNRWLRMLLDSLFELPCHLVVTAKAAEIWEADAGGPRDETGEPIRKPTGQLRAQWKDSIIEYGFTELIRLEKRSEPDGKGGQQSAWWGVVTKQKADRDKIIQIRNITAPLLVKALAQIQKVT